MRDEGARLGVDLAALQAEPAVDAVRPVAQPAVGDGDRADPHVDAEGASSPHRQLRSGAHGMRRMRVAVPVAPRPVLPRDGQLLLQVLVVRAHVLVRQRPVRPDAVVREGREVTRVEARGVARVVHGRAADTATAVVAAEGDWVLTRDDARLCPVEVVAAGLVGDPVAVGIPERPRVEPHDPPAGACEPLQEDRPTGAASHDDQVDLVVVIEASHVSAQAVRCAAAVVGKQPGALVAFTDAHPCRFLAASTRSPHGTGSAASCSGRSHGSRPPRFL